MNQRRYRFAISSTESATLRRFAAMQQLGRFWGKGDIDAHSQSRIARP
jgi:hypothetical protein